MVESKIKKWLHNELIVLSNDSDMHPDN